MYSTYVHTSIVRTLCCYVHRMSYVLRNNGFATITVDSQRIMVIFQIGLTYSVAYMYVSTYVASLPCSLNSYICTLYMYATLNVSRI